MPWQPRDRKLNLCLYIFIAVLVAVTLVMILVISANLTFAAAPIKTTVVAVYNTSGEKFDELQFDEQLDELAVDIDFLTSPNSKEPRNVERLPFGPLWQLICVCGCSVIERSLNFTHVECSMVNGVVRICFLRQLLFYASAEPHRGVRTHRPLLVAVCTIERGFETFFTSRHSHWKAHSSFGYFYDPIGEYRLINYPPENACGQNVSLISSADKCSVPKVFYWAGLPEIVRNSLNGWRSDSERSSVAWKEIRAAPQVANFSVAYIDSADCWANGFFINPWHCISGITTWNMLTLLLENFTPILRLNSSVTKDDIVLFAFNGYNFFVNNKPSGWHEMHVAVSKVDNSYHDDNHVITRDIKAARNGNRAFTVSLQGRFPLSVTNTPLALSLNWNAAALPRPSALVKILGSRLAKRIFENSLCANTTHPLERIMYHFPKNIRLIWPTNTKVKEKIQSDLDNHISETDWQRKRQMTFSERSIDELFPILNVALLIRRSMLDIDARTVPKCKRCIRNVEELAQSVADEFQIAVLMAKFDLNVPVALQLYIFRTASILFGMHGGAWGALLILRKGQAAVEIQAPGYATSEHIIAFTEASYGFSECSSCTTTGGALGTGFANISSVLEQIHSVIPQR